MPVYLIEIKVRGEWSKAQRVPQPTAAAALSFARQWWPGYEYRVTLVEPTSCEKGRCDVPSA